MRSCMFAECNLPLIKLADLVDRHFLGLINGLMERFTHAACLRTNMSSSGTVLEGVRWVKSICVRAC